MFPDYCGPTPRTLDLLEGAANVHGLDLKNLSCFIEQPIGRTAVHADFTHIHCSWSAHTCFQLFMMSVLKGSLSSELCHNGM